MFRVFMCFLSIIVIDVSCLHVLPQLDEGIIIIIGFILVIVVLGALIIIFTHDLVGLIFHTSHLGRLSIIIIDVSRLHVLPQLDEGIILIIRFILVIVVLGALTIILTHDLVGLVLQTSHLSRLSIIVIDVSCLHVLPQLDEGIV